MRALLTSAGENRLYLHHFEDPWILQYCTNDQNLYQPNQEAEFFSCWLCNQILWTWSLTEKFVFFSLATQLWRQKYATGKSNWCSWTISFILCEYIHTSFGVFLFHEITLLLHAIKCHFSLSFIIFYIQPQPTSTIVFYNFNGISDLDIKV